MLPNVTWLRDLTHDVRYGVRVFSRRPVLTMTIVMTLAVAIGTNAAILSITDGILRRPLPYRDPDNLVRIIENVPAGESRGGVPTRVSAMDIWELSQLQTEARTLSHVGGYGPVTKTLTGAGDVRRVAGSLFSADI